MLQATEYAPTLHLVANVSHRLPAQALPRALDPLFAQLAACRDDQEATDTEERIWALWMYHPHRAAARALDRAATEIATQCHDIAETRLASLLRATPDYSEAWHKQAMLYYLQERDEECLRCLHRVLELEPRHFGALCSIAEVLLAHDDRAGALLAFETALRVHPWLSAARERVEMLRGQSGPTVH
jgi:tetratricopeptide (TPR) repeat protein